MGSSKSKDQVKLELLFTLARRFGWVCWYCGHKINVPRWAQKRLGHFASSSVRCGDWLIETHVDHIVPKSKGGTDDVSNLALTCEFCNRAKLNMSAVEYLIWLDEIRFGVVWSPIRKDVEGHD